MPTFFDSTADAAEASEALRRAASLVDRAYDRLAEGFIAAGRIAWHPEPAVEEAAPSRWVSVVFLQGEEANRPELMWMIQYVAKHKTNDCIVHKVDRLARNRADDVTIHLALKDAGVTLVSATENIDETPSGMLLHGIMSSIAEFYSRNLATEVVKGLSQKAAQGGTVTKAPIGYLNVGIRDGFGREVRTVEIDEERARLVRWAFQVFASGDWTTSQLHQEVVARGLTTAASPRRPSRPIAKSSFNLWCNPLC